MSRIQTRNVYHLGLDGVGLLLTGGGVQPAYAQKTASVFMNRFAQGNRSEADFSWWWFHTETDWSQGFQKEYLTQTRSYTGMYLVDLGFFKSGSNIEMLREPGKVQALSVPITCATLSLDTSAKVGYAAGFQGKFIVGINTSGTAKVVSLDSADTVTDLAVPGGAGSSVSQMDSFNQYSYMAFGSATAGTAFLRWDGSSWSNVTNLLTDGTTAFGTAAANGRGVCVAASSLYLSYYGGTSTGDKIVYSTDGTAFAQAVNFTGNGRIITPGNLVNYRGTLYYTIEEGNQVELWQLSSNIPLKLYEWSNLVSPKLSVHLSMLIISGRFCTV